VRVVKDKEIFAKTTLFRHQQPQALEKFNVIIAIAFLDLCQLGGSSILTNCPDNRIKRAISKDIFLLFSIQGDIVVVVAKDIHNKNKANKGLLGNTHEMREGFAM